jgi:hypothetical protein
MGKRKAVRLTTLKVSDELNRSFASEITGLNQLVENLKVCLKREEEKNLVLEERLKELSTTTAKKTSKKKTAVSEAETEKE